MTQKQARTSSTDGPNNHACKIDKHSRKVKLYNPVSGANRAKSQLAKTGEQARSAPSDDRLTDLAREVDEAARTADACNLDDDSNRLGRAINQVAEIAGVTVLLTIVLIIFCNAVGRYAFSVTMIWGDELVLALLPWLGMLGMFLSIRRRQIIRIDFFTTLMPKAVHRALEVLSSVLAAAAFLYLAMISFEYIQLFGADRTIYLQLQKGWFMSAMTIGPVLAALAYIMLAVKDLRGQRRNDSSE